MSVSATESAKPVAWVTGASQGIGRALCLELARRGWRVAASARSLERLQTLSAEPAAIYIADGLETDRFEIRFPPRFAFLMGVLRHLPYSIYFPFIRRITR